MSDTMPCPITHDRVTLDRRELVGLGAAVSAVGLLGTSPASAQNQNVIDAALQTLGDGKTFDSARMAEVAKFLATRPFVPLPNDLPDAFAKLPFEQYTAIRIKPESSIWYREGRGFAVEPLHRGFVYGNKVQIFVVEDGVIRRIGYDRNAFDFGKVPPPADDQDLGFSGFRVMADSGGGGSWEAAIFQGATFFRARARGQEYGVFARTLILKPADTRGEEVPFFRAFWIDRPTAGSGAMVINALLDSENVTGTARFTLRPGEMTITDLEVSLYPRAAIDHVGYGAMTGAFLFGPNDQAATPDVRAAVYEVKGLQIHNGRGEWIWRPVSNPSNLEISAFVDTNPAGFGLLQRDRDYAVFQDDRQRFDRRPSLWLEPLGEWGVGQVQLIEIPTDSELNDNIIAYWRPKDALAAGSEVSFASRLYWCWSPPERPAMAIVTGTRIGHAGSGRVMRFAVDYRAEAFADANLLRDAKATVTASPGKISRLQLWPYPERKILRATFDLDPGSDTASELRLVIENAGKPLGETWLYRWTG
ncbi:glucans biosynthesis protein [Chelatococcus asaccharovorans]|uniref:Glucans biosynthesis protein n=2 Tax=Chelatococcus asaccharovorans TaxID=28210 RepID=A0A2V3UF07_9HYPH|nr:glucans biosynthesis protein [Chelatococcus asaccharovorans]